MAEAVEFFLHRVADEHQRLHLLPLGLMARMREHLAELGMPTAAVDARHQLAQPLGL